MRKAFFAAAILLILGSCTSIDKDLNGIFNNRDGRMHRFYATTEQNTQETKVYADENFKVLWNAGDLITIFNQLTYNSKFVFKGEDGDNAGDFEDVTPSGMHSGNTLDNIYAVYPYSSGNKINNAGNTITLTLPAEQQYKAHSFGIGANTMVAVTDNSYLAFKNLGGYLQLRLYGDSIYVSSIKIQGNNGEKIAGKANVAVGLGVMPTVAMDGTATDAITLVCEPPVLLGTTAEKYTDFWFVIPPTTFSNGFTITVTDNHGGTYEKSTTKSLTIARSTMEWMSALEVAPETANVNVNPAEHVADVVDLGLSVKWASWNVGAAKPSDIGGRYAWGEIETKTYYDWDNYKWCSGTSNSLTKYCTSSSYGTVDGKVILDVEDDAAQVYWGNDWRMPTQAELTELANECSWVKETLDGVSGYRVTGPNGNSIFIPINGQFDESGITWSTSVYLWSSETSGGSNAYLLKYTGGAYVNEYNHRHDGLCIRPVFNSVVFDDANFKAYCVENFDKNGDGEISMAEAELVTSITVNPEIVASLKGIEKFKNLESFTCRLQWNGGTTDADGIHRFYYNGVEVFSKLTSIDLSNNKKLKYLDCSANSLHNLDVSNNVALQILFCQYNQLTSLDLSNNSSLSYLQCSDNQLASLDLSHNTELTSLLCYVNKLTSLDVSNNTALIDLSCGSNQLTALDVSYNTALTCLECALNQLTALDVRNNIALTSLSCYSNQLTSLDVSNNTALIDLSCGSNQLTALDVRNNTALTYLHCSNNQLTSLDVNNNIALNSLYCYANQLTNLNVDNNTALTYFICSNNQLLTLDVSNNWMLTHLDCVNSSMDILYMMEGQVINNLTKSDSTVIVYKDAPPVEEYAAIDLGLPSGIKWASKNIGARWAREAGGRYAWGEITTKTHYDWDTYKWCEGTATSLTKYCTNSAYGTVDGLVTLEQDDDVAYQELSDKWRMPTTEELQELMNKCAWLYCGDGYRVTGPNGNSIFLPVNGQYDEGGFSHSNAVMLWSNETDGSYSASRLIYAEGETSVGIINDRHDGLCVRAVFDE